MAIPLSLTFLAAGLLRPDAAEAEEQEDAAHEPPATASAT